ncbi:MAG TPA: primosomal replication protein N [Novimethylophilus sp.]|uniref:primosomal replication protein N n=1 Tax=Novimethylophilus sp. TaxID=2137426 RepID=UPI002F422426
MSCNRLELSGEIVTLEVLRHTPAGIPVLAFTVKHASIQNDAGMKRQAECEVPVMAMAELAKKAAGLKIGDKVKVAGFLARKSLRNDRLVLHLDELETE